MSTRSAAATSLRVLVLVAATGLAPSGAAHQEATVALGVTFGGDATYRLDVVLDAEHLPALPAPSPAASPGPSGAWTA